MSEQDTEATVAFRKAWDKASRAEIAAPVLTEAEVKALCWVWFERGFDQGAAEMADALEASERRWLGYNPEQIKGIIEERMQIARERDIYREGFRAAYKHTRARISSEEDRAISAALELEKSSEENHDERS